jgi:uncharacterized membrane protein
MKGYITLGLAAAAGAVLIEAALIPGLVIGGAAVLAPAYLPKLRRTLKPALDAMTRQRLQPSRSQTAKSTAAKSAAAKSAAAKSAAAKSNGRDAQSVIAKLGIGQAVAKTITFRVIVTALDFTSNFVVIGELTTAAGLSTFNLVFGPLLYLGHEAAWNYLGPDEGTAIRVRLPSALRFGSSENGTEEGYSVEMSRALAKTITFRTIATVIDFTTLYVVTQDLATAVGLSAFAFVVGPFVYIGHEKLWDYYGGSVKTTADGPEPVKLLPAPA